MGFQLPVPQLVSTPDFERTINSSNYLGVSKNDGTPKSSILIGFSIINHTFWGTPSFGNTQSQVHGSQTNILLMLRYKVGPLPGK